MNRNLKTEENAKRVLILEDEPDAGLLISVLMQSYNWVPTLVTTIAEGTQRLSEQDADSFDLLFFDYNLPDGTSFEILNNKDLVGDVPVILCSAYLSYERQKEAESLGVIDCLHKPINNEVIKNILDKHNLID
jgi:DNA-binding NtrC family response regulator